MAKDRRQEHIAAMEAKAANRPEPRSHFHRPNRKPGDIRTHFHLHTGGYTSEHATTGERGWKLDHNNLQELYLRDAYFEFDPTGHRQYLESFSYDPVAKKDMGYRVVHAHVLGQPADLEIARNYPKEEWRDAGYSVGRAKGMPACFVDRKTGNCLPNDRSVDVWLKNRLNKIPDKDPTVVYRGGRVPTYAADMQYRFNHRARPNTSATHLSRKDATDLFFNTLEAVAGEGQVLYVGPFVLIGDKKGGILGKLEISVFPRQSDGVLSVHLAYIGVNREVRQKGQGRALMAMVVQAADKSGLPIDLEVDPQKEWGDKRPPMNKAQLKAFYQSFGFHTVKGMGRDYMEREVTRTNGSRR